MLNCYIWIFQMYLSHHLLKSYYLHPPQQASSTESLTSLSKNRHRQCHCSLDNTGRKRDAQV